MDVLITGVNGFIGNYVVEYLHKLNYVNIYGTGRHDSYQGSFDIPYFKADISDYNSLLYIAEKMKKCDVIIHLAASISMSFEDKDLIDTNYTGTYNVCRIAQILSCRKIIYLSSIPVIGKPQQLPITETHPQYPESLYHITKLSGEYIVNLMKKNDIIPVVLRIPSPIGVGMNPRTILPTFLSNALLNKDIVLFGKGMRRQNYIDVRDITQAIVKSMKENVEGLFHIASPASISNHELAEECIKVTDSKSIICFNGLIDPQEDYTWDISIEKAKEELKFLPDYSLTASLEWILANR